MSATTVGRRLLSAVVFEAKADNLLRLKLFPALFRDSELVLYEFITTHVNEFGKLPHPDTIETKLGDVLCEVEEPPEYYLKETEKRYLHTKLKAAVLSCQDFLKEEKADAAHALILDLVQELHSTKTRHQVLDFREAADTIFAEYSKQHKAVDTTGIFFGWPSLDGVTAGLQPGDYASIVGRPAAGKTFMLLAASLYGWRKQKQSPMFVSMEMKTLAINQRLAGMDTHKPLTHIMRGALTTKAYKHLTTVLEENRKMPRPFWVIDGNLTATAEDVVSTAQMLKPSSVWVDGAYLQKHKDRRLSRWDRINENAEIMKLEIAGRLGIPVVASYQFNKEVMKKKKDQKPGVEDVYGSDAVGQLSSISLGMFQEEGIETKKRRRVDVMKGRSGETGSFYINWNFVTMDFSELVEEDSSTLQFLG